MSEFDRTRLAVSLALPCESLAQFRHIHVFVWIGARQTAIAHVVSADGQRVLVAYFPAGFDPRGLGGEVLQSDAWALDMTEDELLNRVYVLAQRAVDDDLLPLPAVNPWARPVLEPAAGA